MKRENIALGFYQEQATANKVLESLKIHNFSRFAAIYHKDDHSYKIKRYFTFSSFLIPFICALTIICLVFFEFFLIKGFVLDALLIGLSIVFGATAIYTLWRYYRIIDDSIINTFKNRVITNEILIIVQVASSDVRDVLDILRQVKSGHPKTYLLRSDFIEDRHIEIPAEPLTLDALNEEASTLGLLLAHKSKTFNDNSLLKQFEKSVRHLHFLKKDVADGEFIEQTMPSSAEWFLDNMYVLEANIEEVNHNLSKKYYQELPKITDGVMRGLPKIYVLAVQLVKSTSGSLNTENIIDFLRSYQKNDPLTIGELWAFPLMLRIRLIEWVECLAVHIDNRIRQGELASFWGSRLLFASRHDPLHVEDLLVDLAKDHDSFSGHFAEELLSHLFDEESLIPKVRKILEDYFKDPLDEILHRDHLNETTEQVVFSNLIKSLFMISQTSWGEIFEKTSVVDSILKEDIDGTYSKMDFKTRNYYRSKIEIMAKRSHVKEWEIAKKAISLAKDSSKEYERHVGYYLMDKGRPVLESEVFYDPTILQKIRRLIINHSGRVYLGGILATTLFLGALLYYLLQKFKLSSAESVVFLTLSLLPISELSVQFINFVLTKILPTPILPQMQFETGIPDQYKTFVVVPMMLISQESITEELNRLEIRYLANTDQNLYFGLFADLADNKLETSENDLKLVEAAISGITALEKKYGPNKFFLFCRNRAYSEGEQAWIGWERKRGKLEYLNRFLSKETLQENILYSGNAEALNDICYVITLDSDTKLPKDQARAMIEVLSHPLNRPYINEKTSSLERGYSIIQPRVGTDFVQAKTSLFCKIFSEPLALDPYTQAISNVYQDISKESSYHGKGIYDLKSFHSLLKNRFPENHILSHDLIEGAFLRVGFAGNICLFDTYPKNYYAFIKRQHRWFRGDWQIMDWLKSKVPNEKGILEVNTLNLLNKWKIFDNLRRALLPISLISLLVTGWIFSPIFKITTALGLLVLAIPSLILCLNKSISYFFSPEQSFFKEFGLLFIRFIITVALLPVEAFTSLKALLQVFYRRLISKKNLLQWTSSESLLNGKKIHRRFVISLLWTVFFASIVLGLIYFLNPLALLTALTVCILWILSPLIVHYMDQPIDVLKNYKVNDNDQLMLRKVGLKTWRYFNELIGLKNHFLPPDNYQVALNIEVAKRTSPTNIGMWLVAIMNAYDFRYLTIDDTIDKILSSINSLKNLERYEGHFLNWYNIETLEPLYPRYVSTVDSGNLLASLFTLKQGLIEILSSSILPQNILSGLNDSFEVALETTKISHPNAFRSLLQDTPKNLLEFSKKINLCQKLAKEFGEEDPESYWLKQIEEQLSSLQSIFGRYFEWVEILNLPDFEELQLLNPKVAIWKDQVLKWEPTIESLYSKNRHPAMEKLIESTKEADLSAEIQILGKKIEDALSKAEWFAGEKFGLVHEIIEDIEKFSNEMSLKFLYNSDRKLFSIGYNIEDKRLDNSYYDLLASEARIASFIAIAKDDVPLKHWWSLGRAYGLLDGRKVLLSWGGTMFEYLMPLIFNKQFNDSLIGEACDAAVACQISYGKKRGIPWGISESAFSAIDSHKIYQYKSFGVPGLGLKRGLEDDLVISPYSSFLALAVDPSSAIQNIKKMTQKNHLNLTGPYGYYESMDFTRQRNALGERGVVVYTYMVHHQGMIFASINNLLNNNIISTRFHKDPRISGISSILYERLVQAKPTKIKGILKDRPVRELIPFSEIPIMGVVETAKSVTPKINLLSNGAYNLMITNAGGSYSRFQDIEIYRWRADTTLDCWGSFCYIQDMKSKNAWSATYQPTKLTSENYSVNFKGDKAEFRRKDNQIETFTEVVVSPEDNAEVRLITLINHSKETKTIELTSYMELSLAPHNTDRAHPCFNKLFIETEKVVDRAALIGFRRQRSSEEQKIYALHVMCGQSSEEADQYETDRLKFVGRGNTLKNPEALQKDLSNTTGTVLDPIFSLRRRVIIQPGRRVQVSFVTAAATSYESILNLIEKYKDISASHRALELAWNYSQLELRHLRLQQEEVQLYQKLASRLIYPHIQFRASEDRMFKNILSKPALWAQGISGDLPIVVVTVGDIYDVELVKQVMMAHTFWGLRGLKCDLVVLNEEEMGYFQPLNEQLQNLIQARSYNYQIDTPGGIFLRGRAQLTEEEFNLLLSSASALLIASRGSLRQQLVSPKLKNKYPPNLSINVNLKEVPSKELPFMELSYFNGYGGYTADGRSYVIYLGPGINTPAPWVNVLANSEFGTLVSEAGFGTTWYGNSQSNRLTPWSNDALLNPIADSVYIRDDEMGTYWTLTPSPIRELDPYRITHSQGYSLFEHNSHGLSQELLIFVPVNDEEGLPLKIQRIRIKNDSSRKRKISLMNYSELVLGGDREETCIHVMTEWDSESQSIFGCNRFNADYSSSVAFSCSSKPIYSYTGDRTEFIGRNGSYAFPAALSRKSLSGHVGASLDPCSCLHVAIEIEPEETQEIVFVMGYAKDIPTARELVVKSRDVEKLFSETKNYWSKTLEAIQVDVPDQPTNFAMNSWLLYQALCCRFWARSAFYQSSGAYGFRDQLQDVCAISYTNPKLSRDYILKAAARQYREGDVQHWWHPQTGAGIRTRCSDDLLWLIFVTAQYVKTTGDVSILEEEIPFIEGDELKEEEEEVFQIPTISEEKATLLEHCRRALHKGLTKGAHDLPLIGSCDWNDGMNRVGIHGKGESVWLAWFLIHVMHDFADLLEHSTGNKEMGEGFRLQATSLAEIIESNAWDGAWYRRAYFDDGTPIGSKENSEAMIDSLAQSWSVISGAGNLERRELALQSAEKYLVKAKENLVLLLTPPFDKTEHDPGYIKGYPPGVRENGGQYTHGSLWLAMAYARNKEGRKAADLLKMMTPFSHTQNIEENELYRVEPYAVAADIYDLKGQTGRGGWTWYTGSAAWVYRIWLEEVLGFTLRGNVLSFDCSIPKEWEQFKLNYRYKSSTYQIIVLNPHHVGHGKTSVILDGVRLASQEIPLRDDGRVYEVEVIIEG